MNKLAPTFDDLFTKPLQSGGLGVGTAKSSLILVALLGTCIVYATWQHYRGLRQSALIR